MCNTDLNDMRKIFSLENLKFMLKKKKKKNSFFYAIQWIIEISQWNRNW